MTKFPRAVVILSVLLGAASVTPSFASPVSPTSMALHASDMPAGFHQTRSAWVSNAQAAARDHVSLALLTHEGRVGSYESAFSGMNRKGLLGVMDGVVGFKTSAGAQQDYTWQVGVIERAMHAHPGSVHLVSYGDLGDRRFGFSVPNNGPGSRIMDYAVMFQRGPYWAIVMAFATRGSVSPSQVATYARIIDCRMPRQ